MVNSRPLAQLGSEVAIRRDSKEEEEGEGGAEIGDAFDRAIWMIGLDNFSRPRLRARARGRLYPQRKLFNNTALAKPTRHEIHGQRSPALHDQCWKTTIPILPQRKRAMAPFIKWIDPGTILCSPSCDLVVVASTTKA